MNTEANRHIYKYTLDERHRVKTRVGADVLKIAEQDGRLTVWLIVDTEADEIYRHFVLCGTGEKIGFISPKLHLETVLMSNGLVWHIFEGGEYRA